MLKHQTGYIYLIEMVGTPYIKIGRSKNVPRRIRDFIRLRLPYELRLVKTAYVSDMILAERTLHWLLKEKRVAGEWFTLDPDDIGYFDGVAWRLAEAVDSTDPDDCPDCYGLGTVLCGDCSVITCSHPKLLNSY